MPQEKIAKKNKSRWFNTTVGEFVEAVYEAAMEEYMDELMARRIALQLLIRKLRMQHKLTDMLNKTPDQAEQRKALLRSVLKKWQQKPRSY